MSAMSSRPSIADVLHRIDALHAQLTDIQRRLDVHDQLHHQITDDMRRFADTLRELHVTIYGNQTVPGQTQRLAKLEDNVNRTNRTMTTLAVIIVTPFIASIIGGILWAMAQAVAK